MRYPFIVIYGAPNLGKTIQSKMLADTLEAHYIKYPVYDLAATGPRINAVLRTGLPMNAFTLQKEFSQNRRDYEPELQSILTRKTVVAEAYTGTGLVNGMVEGIDLSTLEKMNCDLIREDLGILLDGEVRFSSGIERGHRFEEKEEIWERTRDIHRELASHFGWEIVNANQSIEEVHYDILDKVREVLLSKH